MRTKTIVMAVIGLILVALGAFVILNSMENFTSLYKIYRLVTDQKVPEITLGSVVLIFGFVFLFIPYIKEQLKK